MDSHSIIGTKNKKGQTFTDPYHLFFEAPRIPSFSRGAKSSRKRSDGPAWT